MKGNCTRRRARCAGVTLLELMIVLVLMIILTGAIGYGFVAGLDMQRAQTRHQAEQDRTTAMEQRITRLLQGARLTDDTNDRTTFFVGVSTGSTNSGDLGSDQLAFTTTAPGVPPAARFSEDDFETQQRARGPVGGIAEVSLSTTPVGNAGDQTGLFERLQRPSDGDSTQGGTETLLAPEVAGIGFQFWDGQQWVTDWDTENSGERRLPAAVQVSYTLKSTANTDNAVRVFVVPISSSDVDAQNPAVASGGSSL